MLSGFGDCPSPGVGTGPATLGAGRKLGPGGHLAVNRAGAVSASLAFFEGWACDPAERMVGDDSTLALLRSLAARGAALAPCGEIINHAVDWACLSVAHPSV